MEAFSTFSTSAFPGTPQPPPSSSAGYGPPLAQKEKWEKIGQNNKISCGRGEAEEAKGQKQWEEKEGKEEEIADGKNGKIYHRFTVFMVISMFVPQVPLNLVIKHNDHFLPIAPENLACREATNGTGFNCELSVNQMVVDDDCRDVSIWARMDNDTSTFELLGEQVKKKLKQFRQNWIRVTLEN
ncbi:hypothetical protein niasHS_013824 [Heterodera schachtii]|uniref:Uncharacterized protein n=1 Tax=Heterodera schachtii TaxID=97005 RepID=A0ABD2IJ32_HETSC